MKKHIGFNTNYQRLADYYIDSPETGYVPVDVLSQLQAMNKPVMRIIGGTSSQWLDYRGLFGDQVQREQYPAYSYGSHKVVKFGIPEYFRLAKLIDANLCIPLNLSGSVPKGEEFNKVSQMWEELQLRHQISYFLTNMIEKGLGHTISPDFFILQLGNENSYLKNNMKVADVVDRMNWAYQSIRPILVDYNLQDKCIVLPQLRIFKAGTAQDNDLKQMAREHMRLHDDIKYRIGAHCYADYNADDSPPKKHAAFWDNIFDHYKRLREDVEPGSSDKLEFWCDELGPQRQHSTDYGVSGPVATNDYVKFFNHMISRDDVYMGITHSFDGKFWKFFNREDNYCPTGLYFAVKDYCDIFNGKEMIDVISDENDILLTNTVGDIESRETNIVSNVIDSNLSAKIVAIDGDTSDGYTSDGYTFLVSESFYTYADPERWCISAINSDREFPSKLSVDIGHLQEQEGLATTAWSQSGKQLAYYRFKLKVRKVTLEGKLILMDGCTCIKDGKVIYYGPYKVVSGESN